MEQARASVSRGEPLGSQGRSGGGGRRAPIDWFPGLKNLSGYQFGWLRADATAGVVLSTMLVPFALAYAVASGVPAINGLYATIAALLAYALFGPSRVLVLTPDSALAPMILAVVLPLANGDPGRAVSLASAMAIVAGIACLIAGIARLGFITELLSKPIRYGYMNGIALAVLISQTAKLLSVPLQSAGPLRDLWAIGAAVGAGKANLAGAVLGLATLALILLLKAHKRVGAILLALIGAMIATEVLHLSSRYGVKVLGPVPQGLPKFDLPWVEPKDLLTVVEGGLAVAVVAFADTSVFSRTFAARTNQRPEPNQEVIALGAANLAAGLFQGFAVSSSSSCTSVAASGGAKSQVSGLIGAGIVALVIVALPTLFTNLPYTALAAVVISAALGLFEFKDLARIRRIQAWEFWLSILCTVGVAVFGAIVGIGLAVLLAVMEFLHDSWRPHWAIMGKPEGVEGYHDIARYPDARRFSGLVLFRWDAPLFFANAEYFRETILGAVETSPTAVHRIVVAAEPITSIDVTAADGLAELDGMLRRRGVELCFAEVKDPVKDKLKRFGLFTQFGEGRFFVTTEAAVKAHLRAASGSSQRRTSA